MPLDVEETVGERTFHTHKVPLMPGPDQAKAAPPGRYVIAD